jgi:uncharacterized protein (TIGR03435 family)
MTQAVTAAIVIAISSLIVPAFYATAQIDPSPRFEVFEIRASRPSADGGEVVYTANQQGKLVRIRLVGASAQVTPVFSPGVRVLMEEATLRQLISAAYGEIIRDDYLSGGPRWLESDRFDLVAKAPPETPVDTARVMIQAALAERFHLQVHREMRPLPVYALVVGKNGSKLSPAEGSDVQQSCLPAKSSPEGIRRVCHNLTMPLLAERLPKMASSQLDLPVVDLTGLSGAYDFQLDWTPLGPADQPVGVTIFGALEKLGLKLERQKHPMPTIVIDRVDRIAAEK